MAEVVNRNAPTVVKEVDAQNGILAEIARCQEAGTRTLPVQVGEIAIGHIAREIYSTLDNPEQSLEVFIAAFRKDVMSRDEKMRHQWEYFNTRMPGHVGVILMPRESSMFFDIITDDAGEHILKYRYWSYY